MDRDKVTYIVIIIALIVTLIAVSIVSACQ